MIAGWEQEIEALAPVLTGGEWSADDQRELYWVSTDQEWGVEVTRHKSGWGSKAHPRPPNLGIVVDKNRARFGGAPGPNPDELTRVATALLAAAAAYEAAMRPHSDVADQTRGRLMAMHDRGEHRQVFRLLLGALDAATLARVELPEDRSARWQAVADRVADRARAERAARGGEDA